MSIKKIVKRAVPPIAWDGLRYLRRRAVNEAPRWHRVAGGVLEGAELFVNNRRAGFAKMSAGTYDDFLFAYLLTKPLAGRVICDVGGHVGYHSLAFAKLAGEEGGVQVFEPNSANLERLRMHLERNRELAARVEVNEFALSDHEGVATFTFSSNVEDQTSSGGFLDGSHIHCDTAAVVPQVFETGRVVVRCLDDVLSAKGIALPHVALIKIDVEGAEGAVLRGAARTLSQGRPCLLIEVHSVVAMLEVCEQLLPAGYAIRVLESFDSSRCFVVAEAQQSGVVCASE